MRCLLFAPGHAVLLGQVRKVRANLESGVIEIYEGHQELVGTINNKLLEVHMEEENSNVKVFYVIQEGIVTVSDIDIPLYSMEETSYEPPGTIVKVFCKYLRELNSKTSIDELSALCQEKELFLEKRIQELSNPENKVFGMEKKGNIIEIDEMDDDVKIMILKKDLEFFKQCLYFAKLYAKEIY
jgi:hypothetical protein